MLGDAMVELIATVAAGLWAGISIYIAWVEHPSVLKVGVGVATEYFRVMSKRTAPLMMVLAAIGGIAAIVAWYQASELLWLFGGALLLFMFPFTAIFIVPTNLRLLKVEPESGEAAQLHERWSRMHWIRTILGVPPFLLCVWLLG
jgi:uncharacterized membrane protein